MHHPATDEHWVACVFALSRDFSNSVTDCYPQHLRAEDDVSADNAGGVVVQVMRTCTTSRRKLTNMSDDYAGGENVYCSEVEAVLSAHSQILQAAVFGVPNSIMGEMVHAALVLRQTALVNPIAPQEVIAWCQANLATYKCPTAVHFADEMPTTGSGKVQKNVLRAMFSHANTSSSHL